MPYNSPLYQLQFANAVDLVDYLALTNMPFKKINIKQLTLVLHLDERELELAKKAYKAQATILSRGKELQPC